jgi:phage shock protein A
LHNNNHKEDGMGILSRALRLCKADLHGVMDQMEDKDLLLRQHLREMQTAMAGRQARIEQFEESLRTGKRDRSRVAQELQNLEADLDRAVARGRDDIARMLIRKLFPVRKRIEHMARRIDDTTRRLVEEQDRMGGERRAYDEIRHRVAAARERRRSAALMADMGSGETGQGQWIPSEEEIEWELLQRKEAASSGRAT